MILLGVSLFITASEITSLCAAGILLAREDGAEFIVKHTHRCIHGGMEERLSTFNQVWRAINLRRVERGGGGAATP